MSRKYAKPAFIAETHHASVAEAVSEFYSRGFYTFSECDRDRIMRDNTGREVRIVHRGMLDVVATEIEL